MLVMRVTKTEDGKFVIDDEPMRLEGEAAERFLAAMKANEKPSAEEERFLAECDRVYRTSKT
jgi:hypothetical protein